MVLGKVFQSPVFSQCKYLLPVPVKVPGMTISLDNVELFLASQGIKELFPGNRGVEFVFFAPDVVGAAVAMEGVGAR